MERAALLSLSSRHEPHDIISGGSDQFPLYGFCNMLTAGEIVYQNWHESHLALHVKRSQPSYQPTREYVFQSSQVCHCMFVYFRTRKGPQRMCVD